MASLSFDNLSSEHLGYWSPIKLKLTPNEIFFKNEKTSKSYHFETNLIRTAEWLYRSRGFGLCLKLTNKKRYYFDGFSEKECEKVSEFFEGTYRVKVKNVETCLKGWNWGKPKFDDEYMEFLIDGMRGFDINLKDVINANLAKNELTLQFQTSDEAFSIYEMRFATVSTNENVMNDMYQNVIKEANILEANEEALVSLKEMHCLQPRGRYEIKLYQQFIHLRGKTYDYSVPKDNILRFYLLPHPDERQIFFVIQVDPPITHGQTRYHFIILLFNNEDEINIDLNCSENWAKETYNGALDMRLSGLTYEVVTKLYKTLYNQKLTVPNKFETKQRSRALTCSYKTTAGFLYPLDKGFIFVPKPAISIRGDEIASVNFSRTMQRTFDFDIETSSGATHTFAAIDQSEYNLLLEFVKFKKYVMSTSSGHGAPRGDDWSASSGESAGEETFKRPRAQGSAGPQDDDDDDEEDEDFNPDEGAVSSVAEEYDSEVSDSTSGSSSGSSKARAKVAMVAKKRPAPEKDEPVVKVTVPVKSKTVANEKKTVAKEKKTAAVAKDATSGKQKKPKVAKDPNAPKKPLTAYFLFANDYRSEAKKTCQSVSEVAKATGEKWKGMSDSEKSVYAAKYKEHLARYQEELKRYQAGGSGRTEVVGKISAGAFKSEEFVQSSQSSSDAE